MTAAEVAAVLAVIGPRPVYERVEGAPYQPGDAVMVVAVVDSTLDADHVGARGTVRYLEYSCGCGQVYPGSPMIGVELGDGTVEEFWPEELALAAEPGGAS